MCSGSVHGSDTIRNTFMGELENLLGGGGRERVLKRFR